MYRTSREELKLLIVDYILPGKDALPGIQRPRQDLEHLADVMAHDLKAPARHISNYAELLESEMRKNRYSRLPEIAIHLKRSAKHMLLMVDAIREFADAGRESYPGQNRSRQGGRHSP